MSDYPPDYWPDYPPGYPRILKIITPIEFVVFMLTVPPLVLTAILAHYGII
jgi:hypothetical protein